MNFLYWASLLAEGFILWFTPSKMCPPWIKQWLSKDHLLHQGRQSLGAKPDSAPSQAHPRPIGSHSQLLEVPRRFWVDSRLGTSFSPPHGSQWSLVAQECQNYNLHSSPCGFSSEKHGMGPLYYTVFSLPWAYWWHPDTPAVREKHRMTVFFDCLFPWFSLLDWLCALILSQSSSFLFNW